MKKKVKITYLSIKFQQSLKAPANASRCDFSSFEILITAELSSCQMSGEPYIALAKTVLKIVIT